MQTIITFYKNLKLSAYLESSNLISMTTKEQTEEDKSLKMLKLRHYILQTFD